MDRKPTFLLISSFYKGGTLIEECKQLGVHTILVTLDKLKDKPWPWHAIDERFFMPESFKQPDLTHAISYLARDRELDCIIPLDDFDVEVAASLREHLRTPGMGDSTARHFRDKLAMRVQARDEGVNVPDFVHVLNHKRMSEFMHNVPGPWVLKPRSEAGSIGIKKCQSPQQVWGHVARLGDNQSNFLLEAYVPGDVFHVDSSVYDDKVLFALASRYHTPPFDIWNGGGVFKSQTVDPKDPVHEGLMEINKKVIKAMRLKRGVTHAEFIRDRNTGKLYFLEMASRVGGANLDKLVEAASGINLWREWPRLELAYLTKQPYKLAKPTKKQAGLLICLSRDEHPDLSPCNEDVWWKLSEEHHAGLIVASDSSQKVTELMERYSHHFNEKILAVQPPTETAVH